MERKWEWTASWTDRTDSSNTGEAVGTASGDDNYSSAVANRDVDKFVRQEGAGTYADVVVRLHEQ